MAGALLLPGGKCGSEAPGPAALSPAAVVKRAVPTPTPPPDPFQATVRPILVAHCAPCHEPGGQLYARLPFDDPTVVAAHAPGILRRLKGDDRATVEKWVASLPDRPSPGR